MFFQNWLTKLSTCVAATMMCAAPALADWTNKQNIGGEIIGEPDAVASRPGQSSAAIHIFARGTDNALWERTWVNYAGKWTDWAKVGGILTSPPSCTLRKTTIIDCFVLTTGDQVSHIAKVNGKWTDWDSLGIAAQGAPEATTNGSNYIYLSVRGKDNALWDRSFDENQGGWIGWQSRGGIITASPGCAPVYLNTPLAANELLHVRCIAAATGATLWIWNPDAPSGWSSFGGETT